MNPTQPLIYPTPLQPMTELQKRRLQIGCKGMDEKQVVDGTLRLYFASAVAAIFFRLVSQNFIAFIIFPIVFFAGSSWIYLKFRNRDYQNIHS